MTDVPGTFAIVVCLYGCLRALQASTTGASAAWISFAALANAVGGTARQIAWLGVLVICPCTVWLLRRQRRVVIAGTISVVTGIAIVAGSLQWFSQQPHINPEPSIFHSFSPALRLLFDQFRRFKSGCFIPCTPSVACVHSRASAERPPGDCNCSRAAAGVRREGCAALLLPCADPVVDTAVFHHWRKRHLSCRNMGVCASIWRAARVVEPARRYRHDSFCARSPNLGGLGDWLWKSQTIPRPQAGICPFVAKPARRLATIPVGLSVPADAKGYEHRTL